MSYPNQPADIDQGAHVGQEGQYVAGRDEYANPQYQMPQGYAPPTQYQAVQPISSRDQPAPSRRETAEPYYSDESLSARSSVEDVNSRVRRVALYDRIVPDPRDWNGQPRYSPTRLTAPGQENNPHIRPQMTSRSTTPNDLNQGNSVPHNLYPARQMNQSQYPVGGTVYQNRHFATAQQNASTTAPEVSGAISPRHSIKACEDEKEYDRQHWVQNNPKAFFSDGTVFQTLWAETAGVSATSTGDGDCIFRTKFNQRTHANIRRMIVVKTWHGHSWCIPVTTYGGRGSSKEGIDHRNHGKIYMKGAHTSYQQSDSKLGQRTVMVDAWDPEEKLDPDSVVHFAKVHSVEHNVKVKLIGRISKDSMKDFRRNWRKVYSGHAEKRPEHHERGNPLASSDVGI